MSADPELPDDEALAAEHALGVLSVAERSAAETRMARDPDFAKEVEAWRERLTPLLGEVAEVPPPVGLWSRVETALPVNDNSRSKLRFWRGATLGSLGLAAASLAAVAVLVAQRPAEIGPSPLDPGVVLNARLDSDKGQHLFVASYDRARRIVMISSLVPPGTDLGHVHELWLIPADGKPRPLGFVPVGASVAIPVSAPMVELADSRAALAISVEAPGGSKEAGPTGPVVALGKLTKI